MRVVRSAESIQAAASIILPPVENQSSPGIPLGIHGSAGYTDDQMRRMIGFGAAKINYSALLDIAPQRIRANVTAGALGYAAVVAGVREAVQLETERCIQIWGGSGRAAELLQQGRARKSFAFTPLAEKTV